MPVAAGLYYFVHQPDAVGRPPVVLIHGAGGDHLYWPSQVRRLQDERVFAVDLPGHGNSAGVGSHSIEDYGAQIIEFVRALKLSRVILVGHSMGGAVALQSAIKYPRRVLGLGIIGSGARLPVNPTLLYNASKPETAAETVHLVTELSFAAEIDSRLKDVAAQRLAQTRSSVLYGDFLACDAFNASAEQLARISIPTLLVFGAADRMTPVTDGEALRAQIRGARLEVVPKAGHMVMLEQPHRIAQLLGEFVKSIPYQPGK